MQIHTQEHIEMMEAFERNAKSTPMVLGSGMRFDREDKDHWPKGFIYQNLEVNRLFLMWRCGYATARCVYLS